MDPNQNLGGGDAPLMEGVPKLTNGAGPRGLGILQHAIGDLDLQKEKAVSIVVIF